MMDWIILGCVFLILMLAVSLVSITFFEPDEPISEFLKRRIADRTQVDDASVIHQVIQMPTKAYLRVLPFFVDLAKKLYANNQAYLAKTRKLMITANCYRDDADLYRHFAFSLFVSCISIGLGLILALVIPTALINKLLILVLCVVIARFVPDLSIRQKAKNRKLAIYYTLSDVLDLLVVCMESGLGMDASMMRVAQETARLAPELNQELNKLLFEVSSGISRAEAFRNMAERTDVTELASLAAMLIQADKFGTPMGSTLKVYSDDLRQKRRMKAEELASKASIKMTFPLVLLIFPPMFIILLGPSIISAMDIFGKK
jgi:pilus assembly protein TadC